MKILILGSGGREHALAWKFSQSELAPAIYIAPGNAGTLHIGENVNLSPLDFEGIREFCIEKNIEMVVVGPEEPLVKGIYDYFKNDPALAEIAITGPSAEGAQLEGSKAFAKAFMERHGIPTARYREFTPENFEEGLQYISGHSMPVVIKADGLAAGKGVVICHQPEEAIREFSSMIRDGKFGDSGRKVVVEEFLDGIELSVFICTDGKNYVLLPEAKDYKKVGEGDEGLNTGGMGAISPVPFATDSFMQKVLERVVQPTMKGLIQERIDYKGFIFFGLIKVGNDPYVIEYNCRLGDPEAEVILLRLENDLIEILSAMHRGDLHKVKAEISANVALTTVAVSGGYPLPYSTGKVIEFNYLRNPMEIKHLDANGGAIVFHAGTRQKGDQVVTNGGRVLAVSALTPALAESFQLSKEIMEQIRFDGMYYRADIGYEFLK